MLRYSDLVGFDSIIEDARSLGLGVEDDEEYRALVDTLREQHGLEHEHELERHTSYGIHDAGRIVWGEPDKGQCENEENDERRDEQGQERLRIVLDNQPARYEENEHRSNAGKGKMITRVDQLDLVEASRCEADEAHGGDEYQIDVARACGLRLAPVSL